VVHPEEELIADRFDGPTIPFSPDLDNPVEGAVEFLGLDIGKREEEEKEEDR
jgi:hypothetical protein